jgi:quinol monooxygenase YgiN
VFVRVWQYDVRTVHVADFVAAYGRDGDWARLFRAGDGYLGTDLYRGADAPGRFLTVDRWADSAAWQAFLATSGPAYQALDARLAHLADGGRLVVEGDG